MTTNLTVATTCGKRRVAFCNLFFSETNNGKWKRSFTTCVLRCFAAKQTRPSSFQVQSQQNDAPIDYEKMLEAMTQARIARDHKIDMMVQTLRSHRSAISDVTNHSLRAEESRCFGKQDSITVC